MTGERDGGRDRKSICRPLVVIRGGVGASEDKDNRNKEESCDLISGRHCEKLERILKQVTNRRKNMQASCGKGLFPGCSGQRESPAACTRQAFGEGGLVPKPNLTETRCAKNISDKKGQPSFSS